MQTPGLPASQPTSSNRTANDSAFEKPAHAGEAFGEVMNRALNNSGTGVPPVRPEAQSRNPLATAGDDADEYRADEKSLISKSKSDSDKPTANRKPSAGRKSENSDTTAPFGGIAAPPTPAQIPNSPSGNTDDSPKGKTTPDPISADATNTEVTDADPTEAKPTDSAKESAATALDPKMFKTADMVEHAEKSPPATVAEELASAVEAVEANSDATETAASASLDPQSGPVTQAKAGHESKSTSPPDPNGTSVAKQDVTMKKADKTQKIAGSAEQDLPGNPALGSEELPEGQKLSAKAPVHGEKPDATAIELPTRISTSVDSPAPTVTAVAVAPSFGIDSRVLERTHDIVALHAMRLNETGSDSLRVVVKPGDGIQLSLELRQSARGIEVSAELHKGDFQQLNQHWSDLQQRLEARGVRVGTLTTAENYTNDGHQQFNQSKQQSPNQDSLQAGAFAEFALSGSLTEAPEARAARATAYRGWETWA